MGACQIGKNFPGVWYFFMFQRSNLVEPSSAEVLGNVADMSRDDFIRAIKIADKGFRKYSISTTFAERGAQLRKWFDLIQQNLDDCKSQKRVIILTVSGKNSQFREWKDFAGGKGRSHLCCIVHSVVQRRSSSSVWRRYSLVSSQHHRLHAQATRRCMWNHHAVEFSSSNDHS